MSSSASISPATCNIFWGVGVFIPTLPDVTRANVLERVIVLSLELPYSVTCCKEIFDMAPPSPVMIPVNTGLCMFDLRAISFRSVIVFAAISPLKMFAFDCKSLRSDNVFAAISFLMVTVFAAISPLKIFALDVRSALKVTVFAAISPLKIFALDVRSALKVTVFAAISSLNMFALDVRSALKVTVFADISSLKTFAFDRMSALSVTVFAAISSLKTFAFDRMSALSVTVFADISFRITARFALKSENLTTFEMNVPSPTKLLASMSP